MSGIQRREVAYRLFASEFDDATLSHQESDEERAPNYVVTPSGARVNRVFVVGVLTEVESVNEDVLRGRIVDPTGAFVVYAGQYQPDEMAALEQAQPPQFVAVTGKARTFSPDDSDRVYTSIRPESINVVDAETRDRWVVGTAEQTLQRVATYAEAAAMDEHGDALTAALEAEGVPAGLANGIPLAMQHYDTTPAYLSGLRQTAIEAARVVAGEQDEVSGTSLAPSDKGDGTVTWGDLRDSDRAAFGVMPVEAGSRVAESAEEEAEAADESTAEAESDSVADEPAADSDAEAGVTADSGGTEPANVEADAGSESKPATETEPESEPEPAVDAEPEPDQVAATESVTDAEAEPEPATSLDADDDDIGDFEPGNLGGDTDDDLASAADETADAATVDQTTASDETDASAAASATPEGMYQMDDEERQEIEEEFGTEFSSGTDVPDPGESDIETPTPEAEPEPAAEEPATEEPADEEPEPEPAAAVADEDPSTTDETESVDEAETDDDPAEEVDLDDYVMEVMQDLDDGDGADREELVAQVVADTQSAETDVEDAIQNALIGGQCYEPDDDTLKPI
ncbi:RPA family protein [Haloarchaeobius sp. DT45]|uniref:RPA family protein n=1 Tax=Haloarchaeobius sp. DT45 TaxID=3446116 RepID=UPI003F6C2F99